MCGGYTGEFSEVEEVSNITGEKTMSNMSQFNYECQELAENYAFVSVNTLIAMVKKQFADRPAFLISHAIELTLDHAEQIRLDIGSAL